MARLRVSSLVDGGGDSFYSAVAEAKAAAATPKATISPLQSFRDKEASTTDSAATRKIVDEQTKAKQKAAQAPKAPDLTTTPYEIDPYYKKDPVTGLSPAQVEAYAAQDQAKKDLEAAKAAADALKKDPNATPEPEPEPEPQPEPEPEPDPNASKSTSPDTTVTGSTTTPGAGGAGPENAAQQAVIDQIAALTKQIADMEAARAAEAAKPKVVGTRTVRKTGGVVEVVEVMSDGSQGKVVDSYKDFGARDSVMQMFENTGLGDAFIKSLMDTVDKVYEDNIMPTEAQVLNSIYNSDAYKQRFSANEIIRKRMADGQGRPGDRLLKPAEYIATENQYRELMSEAGLPAFFYDQPEDFAKFIGELGTSVAEVAERINIAKQALQNADNNVKQALKDYYGLSENDMVAYLLDPDKAFNAINSRFKFTTAEATEMYTKAEVGGAALRAGMQGGISQEFAGEITKAGKADAAERAFQGAARDQADYQRLMGLYGEQAGTEDLAREALALTGGAEVGIKTKKLASKERAKFMQRSALDRSSLGSRLKTPDV